jgi:putative restriction endonuclease
MHTYIAITDPSWHRFLAARPDLDELNFWQPGGSRAFKALSPGEPFLFKLHSPHNFIVGGGFFAHFTQVPASLAWEAFGEKNGAASYEEMRRRIGKYRRAELGLRDDPTIGCIVLTSPFFFDEIDWIPIPEDFHLSIQQGKTYDTATGEGRKLWERVEAVLRHGGPGEVVEPEESAMYGDPVLVRPRLGQGAFQLLVTDTYERHCAVTGERALPTLDAAHIRGVAAGGQHRIDNGLLLRTDIHRLFDKGYVTVTPDHRFRVSRRLKSDFDNGEPYYALDGREIWLPPSVGARPSREFLEWHADSVFRG